MTEKNKKMERCHYGILPTGKEITVDTSKELEEQSFMKGSYLTEAEKDKLRKQWKKVVPAMKTAKKYNFETTVDEYEKISADKTCHVPLIQTIKLLDLEKSDLPVIRVPADNLADTFQWLESEKAKGLYVYNYHIEKTKDDLIKSYPEIKDKLWENLKLQHSKFSYPSDNPNHKCTAVCEFIDSALILELDIMMNKLNGKPAFIERTLH